MVTFRQTLFTMTTSNTLFLLFACLLTAIPLSAQEGANAQPTEEIGLRLTNLQDFNLIYKKELKNGNFRRLRFAAANVGLTVVQNTEAVILNAGLSAAIGWEKRVAIADKLVFHHGWEPGISLGFIATENFNQLTVSPFVGYVLGFQLAVSDRFMLGLEVTPSARVTYATPSDGVASVFQANVGFNTSAVGLTATYRFTRN